MKQLFLKILLSFFITLFFISCEKETAPLAKEETVVETTTQKLPNIKRVSYQNVPPVFNSLQSHYKLSNYLEDNNKSEFSKGTSKNNNVVIHTDVIKEITIDDYTSYTMEITIPNSPTNKLYNLTIEDKNGVEGMFVTTYTFAESSQTGKGESNGELTGVSTQRVDDFTTIGDEDNGETSPGTGQGGGSGGGGNNYGSSERSPYYPTDCYGTVIVTYETETVRCGCVTPGHLPGQCEGPCSSPGYYVDIPYYYCEPYDEVWDGTTTPDPNNTNPPRGGGNSGAGGPNPDDDPSYTVQTESDEPCEPAPEDLNGDCTIDAVESIAKQVSLTDDQMECLYSKRDATEDVLNFLLENNYSREAKAFVMNAINPICNGEISNLEEVIYVVEAASNPIENLAEYLSCFDTTQRASLTIYVNEPIDGTNSLLGRDRVGHTFVSIQQGNNIASYGFYPKSSLSSLVQGTQGVIENNSNTEYDVSLTINNISPSRLQAMINLSISYSISDYHLSQRNCTDLGIVLGNIAGLPIPECKANPIYFFGSSPGRLGEYIRNLTLPTGVTRNKDGGYSPNNNCN